MKTVFDGIEHSVKNWWMSLILGILYIGVAICLMFAPLSSYVALSIVFSISMLISGILEILFAISNKHVGAGILPAVSSTSSSAFTSWPTRWSAWKSFRSSLPFGLCSVVSLPPVIRWTSNGMAPAIGDGTWLSAFLPFSVRCSFCGNRQ